MDDELLEEYRYPTLFGEAEVFCLLDEDEPEEACASGEPGCAGTPIRVLYVGGGFQSATYLGERRFEPVFEYYRAFDRMFEAPRSINRVLMIGGGAFSYPKHLLTSRENVSIDVVEIDPAIVEIARKHFFLDELESAFGEQGDCPAGEPDSAAHAAQEPPRPARLRTIIEDGASYLARAQSGFYDALINDSFDGTNPTNALLGAESLAHAKRCLAAGGQYLLNVVVDPQTENAADAVGNAMRALAEHFACVYEIPCIDLEFSGADNYLVIATDTPCAFSGVASALIS